MTWFIDEQLPSLAGTYGAAEELQMHGEELTLQENNGPALFLLV